MTGSTTNLTNRRTLGKSGTTVQVFSPEHFPAPDAGVIKLEAGRAYQYNGTIDISPNRIELTGANTLYGADPFNDNLISDTTEALITGVDASLFIYTLGIQCPNGTAYDLRNTAGNEKTSIFTVTNVLTTADVYGRFENMLTVGVFDSGATVSTEGIEIVGSQNGVVTINFLLWFDLGSSVTCYKLGTSIMDDFKVSGTDAAYVLGNTFISGLANGGNLIAGSAASISHNSSTGSPAVLDGVGVNDDRWFFFDNDDLANSDSVNPPAGSDTEIQFNNGGVLGADQFLNWNNTNKQLGVGVVPDASAILHVQSASRGFLGPAMTDAEADNISSPADGLQIVNITEDALNVFFGGTKAAISTHPTTEDNIHTGSSIPGTNETLAKTLTNGNTTGGNNIVISSGDAIVSDSDGNDGAPLLLGSGFGINSAGFISISVGVTDNGPGADWTRTAGPGGTDGGTGPGGDIIDISGSGNSNNQPSGDLHYFSGNPDGAGAFGDMYLMEDGGSIAVGHNNKPATIVDIQAGGPTVTVRNTADFGRSDIDLYGSRNAGAGNAELGSVSIFNTRSGSDVMVARMAFVNGQSGTSAGGINFLTKENADGSLSIRLSIDDAGNVLINGEDASRVATDTVEIFTSSKFDELATAGVITVDGVSLSIIFKDSITSTNSFNVINGGRLTLRFDAAWTYSGTGTVQTVATGGTLNIKDGGIFGNSSATLFDVTAASSVTFSNNTVLFFGEYGTIRETANVLMSGNGFFLGNGSLSLIDNASTAISSWGLSSGTPVSGALVRVSGLNTGFFDFSASNIALQSGESFIRFDPDAPVLQATLDKIRAVGGELFDTTGGIQEDFTAVADASIGATAVSVTDSGGFARFSFTGPTVYVNQRVITSTFTTNPDYNDTFIIPATDGTTFFDSKIPYGSDESGSFLSKSITLTITATTLSNGDTGVIDTDLSTDYFGGTTFYNKLTNSVQANIPEDKDFTVTHTGTVNTAGIDHTDPRILAFNNPGFADSTVIATGESHGNGGGTATTITDGVYIAVQFGTFVSSSSQRLKHLGNNKYEVTSKEPVCLQLSGSTSQTKSGATIRDYRFAISIDDALPVYNVDPLLSDSYEDFSATSVQAKVPITLFTGDLVEGQTIQLMVAGQGNADDLTFDNSTLIWSRL